MRIRNSVKAIIIENDQLLCIEYKDERGVYYGVPGGGQDYQETLHEAMQRECWEEVQVRVDVGPMLFVREYIGKYHPSSRYAHVHQVELFFRCHRQEGEQPAVGEVADEKQIGVRWVPLTELEEKRNFWPQDLLPFLRDLRPKASPVYLGELN